MSKRIAVAVAGAVVAVSVLGLAQPASAANLCGSGYMCTWQGWV